MAPTKPLAPVTRTGPEPGVSVRGAAIAAAVESSDRVAAHASEDAKVLEQRIGVLLRAL